MRIFKTLDKIQVLDERFYTLDKDTYYPSVTTVLNAYPKGYHLLEWMKKNGEDSDRILNEAAEQGSNVHNAIEEFLSGKTITWIDDEGRESFTLKEWQMICKFMDFYHNVESVEQVEMMLFSKKHRIGGTLDLVCVINGEKWLIDFKTSNGIYKTYELQLAIYKEVYEDMMKAPGSIDRYGVLWLNASTRTDKPPMQGKGWQIKEFTKDHAHNLKLYNHTRALWDEENPNYKPKNLEYPNSFIPTGS